ncbi:MAG: glycosyl hydrolase family 28-related protein [Planctomycetota bacterium]
MPLPRLAIQLVLPLLLSANVAAEQVLIDDGFEPDSYDVGDGDRGMLVGQKDWQVFPGGRGDRLIVSRNAAISGEASLRSLTAKKSGAVWPLDWTPDAEVAEDLVITFTVGSNVDDWGNAAVGLTGSVDALNFLGVHRVGKANQLKTKRATSANAKEKNAHVVTTDDADGLFEVELTVRAFPGTDNDHAAARFRVAGAGDDAWQSLAFAEGADGMVNLGRDVPETLFVYVVADGQNFRRAPRVDDLRLVVRPAPSDAKPVALTTKTAPTALDMPVTDGRYPPTAGIIDVKQHGATGDGTTDDTAALQAALDTAGTGNRIVYLPAGTYLITDTLRWPNGGKGREQKRTILEGAGRDRTIIRLADNAPGFADPDDYRAMVWTGDAPAQRFRNGLRDLTLDTGHGNPGVAALQFNTSNQGMVERVTLRSGDGTGVVGLDLAHTREVGNAYFHDLRIVGFDHGVLTTDRVNGLFFERLTLEEQRIAGIHNAQQVMALRGVRGDPIIRNTDGGVMCLDAGTIQNDGGIVHTGSEGLNFPVEDVPAVDWPTAWITPDEFGAVADGDTDDTAALQRAADAGAALLLAPGRTYRIDGTLHLRGDLQRILSTGGTLTGNGTLLLDGDGADPLLIENIEVEYGGGGLRVVHRGSRPLIVKSCMLPHVTADADADLHLVDVSNHKWRKNDRPLLQIDRPGQRVFARNLNPENHESPKLVNHGGDLWIFGLKTENHHSVLHQTAGTTEVFGGHIYAQNKAKTRPAFDLDGGRLVLVGVRQYSWKDSLYPVLVRAGEHEHAANAVSFLAAEVKP